MSISCPTIHAGMYICWGVMEPKDELLSLVFFHQKHTLQVSDPKFSIQPSDQRNPCRYTHFVQDEGANQTPSGFVCKQNPPPICLVANTISPQQLHCLGCGFDHIIMDM